MSCHSLVLNLCGCVLSWVEHALCPPPPHLPIQPGHHLPPSSSRCTEGLQLCPPNILPVLFLTLPEINSHGQTCLDQRRFKRFVSERRPTDKACASQAHWAVFILRGRVREREWMGGFVEDGLFDGYSLRKIKWLLRMLGIEGEMKITLFETWFDGLINEYGPFSCPWVCTWSWACTLLSLCLSDMLLLV